MQKLGGWTRTLHEQVRKPTSRPAWICGPFASPYSVATNYDNLILVASGIGITPAMSIVTSLKETRRTHVLWACREPSLLEFYLENCIFDDDAWTLIYYTGTQPGPSCWSTGPSLDPKPRFVSSSWPLVPIYLSSCPPLHLTHSESVPSPF